MKHVRCAFASRVPRRRHSFGRPLLSVVVVAALTVAIAACGGSDESESESGPVKVGLLTSLTGPGAVFGESTKQAAELAVAELNANDGVLGRKVELVIADDATDPKTGNEAMNRLIRKDQVDIVFGQHSSATRDAVKQLPIQAKTLYVYTPVYEGGGCDKEMFYTGEVPNQQIDPTIPYMMESTGGKTWFFVGNDYVWPRTLAKEARSAIEKAGGSVVGEEYAPLGTSDFSSTVSKVRAANPDLIFAAVVGGDAVGFVKAAHAFGIDAPILGPAMEENTILGIGGPAAAGVNTPLGYFYGLDTPGNTKFKAAIQEMFGAKAPPQNALSESVYEAMNLWALGAKKADSLEVDKVGSGMQGMTFDGPRGKVSIDAENHHLVQPIYLAQAQPDGSLNVTKSFPPVKPVVDCDG